MSANREVAQYQVMVEPELSEPSSEETDQQGDAQSIVEAVFRSMTSTKEYDDIVLYATATDVARQSQITLLAIYNRYSIRFSSLFEGVATSHGGTRHQMRSDVQDYIRANSRALSLCVGSDQRRMARVTSARS